ncbi:MAG: redoxin domain-containing protein [Planctomycetaceae bacterium]|jgi:thiol-disulfide isomerase/thioredoxin|nr:redoxin domain-containing protein [Planctomycetaceae bacterium]
MAGYGSKFSLVQVNLSFVIILFCLVGEGCSCSHGTHEHNPPVEITDPANTSTTTARENEIKDNEKKVIEILDRMVTAYRTAKSYADHGRGRIVGKMVQPDAEPITWSCTVAFRKPDKLRIECNEGKLISYDGNCYAQIRALPEQVLRFPTPELFTFDKLFSDVELDQSMNVVFPSGVLRFPPQLILLFAEDPLKTFLPEGSKTELLESQSIGNIPCDVIKIKHDRGDRVLWISRRNSALLQFDYMVEGLLVAAEFESVRTIRIEMNDAQFDLPVAEEAFMMLQPENAKQVSEFKPVETEILGKRLTDLELLKFEELIFDADKLMSKTKETQVVVQVAPTPDVVEKTPDNSADVDSKNNNNDSGATNNDPVTLNGNTKELPLQKSLVDLRGKISVFCFWTTWSEPCRRAIGEFYKAADENANNKNVQFFVINSNDNSDDQASGGKDKQIADLKSYCEGWGIRKPYWREVGGKLTDALSVDSFPTIVVIGKENRVEFYSRGGVQTSVIASLLKEIEEGKKPYEKNLGELQKILKQRKIQHLEELKLMVERDFFALSCVQTDESVVPKLVPQSLPKTFTLEKKWEIALASTGNIALLNVKNSDKKVDGKVDGEKNGEAKADKQTGTDTNSATKNRDNISETILLVPCEGNSVALIDTAGKLIRKVTPEGFANDELLTFVRTSIDSAGDYVLGGGQKSSLESVPVYVGFSSNSGSVVHIFDADFKSRLRYVPQRKAADVKLKISDFRFVDLDGVGEPEVAVGVVAIDGNVAGGDSICVIDLEGKEIWRDDKVTSPFQIGDYKIKGQRGLYGLDAVDSVVKLRMYSADGKRLESAKPNALPSVGISVWCFLFDVVSGNLCTIISAADGEWTAIAVLSESGAIRWQKPLPAGEYNLLAANLLGESKREWIAVSRLGEFFVFDQLGNQVDSFTLGEPITGLVIIAGQLIVATGSKVIAWQINE